MTDELRPDAPIDSDIDTDIDTDTDDLSAGRAAGVAQLVIAVLAGIVMLLLFPAVAMCSDSGAVDACTDAFHAWTATMVALFANVVAGGMLAATATPATAPRIVRGTGWFAGLAAVTALGTICWYAAATP